MPLTVLIVDDSAVTRKHIARTLRLSGLPLAAIHEAANGAEGLERLRHDVIDLVLLDLNMPVMTGDQMLAAMRQDRRTVDVPVIVVSTEGSTTRLARLVQHRVGFVHKPFQPEAIRDAVCGFFGIRLEDLVGGAASPSPSPGDPDAAARGGCPQGGADLDF